jgi:hypothetical protein
VTVPDFVLTDLHGPNGLFDHDGLAAVTDTAKGATTAQRTVEFLNSGQR